MEGHGNYNNAIAVWLRSEITDVLAPMDWQLEVPTVTVVRQDRKPLTRQLVESLSEFNRRVGRSRGWSMEGGGNHLDMIKRAVFEDFCREFSEKKKAAGDAAFGEFAWWANLGEGYREPE